MTRLHLDGETTSALELPAVGLHAYLSHPSTRVHHVAWTFDQDFPRLWFPGEALPVEVKEHLQAGAPLWAHNAPFERWMINLCHGTEEWPRITIEQTYCTLSMSAAMAIPLDLGRACAAVGIPLEKDPQGVAAMLFLAKLDPDGSYRTKAKYPREHALLEARCVRDVVMERLLGERLLELSPQERTIWIMDQRINDRGVRVDEAATRAALVLVKAEEARLNAEMERVTKGYVSTTNCHVALRDWIEANGGPSMPGVAKDDVEAVLEDQNLALPHSVRVALELRHEAAKSSTKKLIPMLVGRCADGLMRGLFQFCGAGRTLRWSGRRAQVQNYPRQQILRWIINFFLVVPSRMVLRFCALFEMEPMALVSQLLRGMLIACPGTRFLAADLAQIEARMAAWLAQDLEFLAEFRGRGKVYERDAAAIYGVPVEAITKGDERRQVGKVSGLAFQYGGGVNAFRNMGKIYKIPPFSDAAITGFKDRWRASHPAIVRYWSVLEAAALGAVRNPGQEFSTGQYPEVRYVMRGSWLFCLAPSGSVAVYPYPLVEMLPTPWGELKPTLTYRTVKEEGKGADREWVRTSTWGGKLFENLDQRCSRDVFAERMLDAEAAGYPLVMHGHDEAVARLPYGKGTLEELCAIMSVVPAWAPELPLAVDGWEAERYQK